MRTLVSTISLVVAITMTAIVACTDGSKSSATSEIIISQDSLINLGSHLVNAIGCDDCHSPKKVGPGGFEIIEELRFSGYPGNGAMLKADTNAAKKGWIMFAPDLTATVGPWGMSFAANISSDATGIGNWSEEHFFRAIREGKSKGLEANRPLLPPMPWQQYRNLKDIELKAIFAFLKSTKPVENRVPEWKKWSEL